MRAANPAALSAAPDLDGVSAVVVRLLGGRRAWDGPFGELHRDCAARDIPLYALGGESTLDPELTAASTVAAPAVAQAFAYLVHGGPANLANLVRFVAGEPAGPPRSVPDEGILGAGLESLDPTRPTVAVLFYRAHLIAGNITFVDDLCAAIRARGANALACWCYSLRPDERGDVPVLARFVAGRADCVVTTVLAMGAPGARGSGGPRDDRGSGGPRDDRDDSWSVPLLERLDVPVVQAVAATTSRAAWEESDLGLSPLDVAWSVALPEFDGRIISVPVSFKEVVDDGDELGTPVVAYRTVPDRVERVAGLAIRLARLRH
ncbi:MAG: cobaltochelatase subunit CobN, partial [Actinomycetota bacterium]|nr:cobaltochelatase subunit CobN [Actinomycetota bacterium]